MQTISKTQNVYVVISTIVVTFSRMVCMNYVLNEDIKFVILGIVFVLEDERRVVSIIDLVFRILQM